MKHLFFVAVFLIGLLDVAISGEIAPGQVWTNQRGSVMKITSVGSRGNFRGTFTNNADGFNCKGIPYPVTGTNASVQVSFTVNFAKCRSVATWMGDAQGFGMTVPWVLKYFASNGQPQTTTGFDFFSRF